MSEVFHPPEFSNDPFGEDREQLRQEAQPREQMMTTVAMHLGKLLDSSTKPDGMDALRGMLENEECTGRDILQALSLKMQNDANFKEAVLNSNKFGPYIAWIVQNEKLESLLKLPPTDLDTLVEIPRIDFSVRENGMLKKQLERYKVLKTLKSAILALPSSEEDDDTWSTLKKAYDRWMDDVRSVSQTQKTELELVRVSYLQSKGVLPALLQYMESQKPHAKEQLCAKLLGDGMNKSNLLKYLPRCTALLKEELPAEVRKALHRAVERGLVFVFDKDKQYYITEFRQSISDLQGAPAASDTVVFLQEKIKMLENTP